MPQGAVSDGKHIDTFIPHHLRDMFYRHPTRPYAWNNGLDPYGFSTNGLVGYLPLWALKESTFKSVDAYKHKATVTGALWRPDGRIFDGDDDIDITSILTTSLSALTVGTIIYRYDPAASPPTEGQCPISFADTSAAEAIFSDINITTGLVRFRNFDAGVEQWSLQADANPFTAGTKTFIGLTHDGTAPVIYVDGVAVAQTFTNQTKKSSWFADLTGLDNTNIGTRDWNGTGKGLYLKGTMSEVWFYNRALSAAEMLHHNNITEWR